VAQDTEAEAVEVPAKFKKIVEEMEKLTILEANELVEDAEKKWESRSSSCSSGPRSRRRGS